MAGVDSRVVRQRKELVANAVYQLFVAGTGKICPPNALHEKHIAIKCGAGMRLVESDMAGRVAGRVQDVQPERADFNNLAVEERYVRLGAGPHKNAKHPRAALGMQKRQIT